MNKKINLKLNKLQIDTLIGLMLGDGHLRKPTPLSNTRLIVHMGMDHKDEIEGIYSIFQNLCGTQPKIRTYFHKGAQRVYKSIYLNTLSYPCLNEYYSLFYLNKKKIIPLNIEQYLSPISLAQ